MKKLIFTFAAMLAITAASAQVSEKTTTTETKTESSVQPVTPAPTVSTTMTTVKHKPAKRRTIVGGKRRTTINKTARKPKPTTVETKVSVQ